MRSMRSMQIVVFGDDTILNKPVEEWPVVDCLLSWHSEGFPLKKVGTAAAGYCRGGVLQGRGTAAAGYCNGLTARAAGWPAGAPCGMTGRR